MAITQVVAARADNGALYNNVPVNKSTVAGGNGGAVAKTSSELLDGVEVSRYNGGIFGSTVIDGTNTDKALSGGVFSHNNTKPISKRLTTSLATVDNTVLESGASQPTITRSIHKFETDTSVEYTTLFRENKYNEYTGKWDDNGIVTSRTATVAFPGYAVVRSFDSDDAANPTREIPGELIYKTNSPIPVLDNYKEKTG